MLVRFKITLAPKKCLTTYHFLVDDQIQSATTLGKLAYKMPAIADFFGVDDFTKAINTAYIANSKDENLKFVVKVANTAEATDSLCPEKDQEKCEVYYNLRYTPLLYDVVPNQVFFDQDISLILNSQRANNKAVITADMDPVVHIKINGTRCDSEGSIDYQTRLDQYEIDALRTKVGNQDPGKNHKPEVRFRVGNAHIRESAKHCNWAGDDCWTVRTHPKITSISAAEGYTTGGQTLTINGWGLKGDKLSDIDIKVDGVACKVLSM